MTLKITPQDLAAVEKAPVFSAIQEKALRRFLQDCQVVQLSAGEQAVRPSMPADRFFVVLEGQVKVFQLSAKGDEQTLHMLGPGETFGEAAMWARIHYPAYAEAISGVRLLVVSRETLAGAIASNAELAMGMMAGLSRKLREFNLLIERLSLKEVPARLAGVLLDEARASGRRSFRLSQSKREIAARIGTVAETLSRALAKLKGRGIIEVLGSQITILDSDALEDLAQS